MHANAGNWRGANAESADPRIAPGRRRAAEVVWFVALSYLWFVVIHAELTDAMDDQASARAVTLTALAALGGRLMGQGIEAAFYTCFWRAVLVPASFARLATAIFSLSMLDAAGLALTRWGSGGPQAEWVGWIVGLRVWPEALSGAPGIRYALANVGLLTVARVVGTAWAQRREGARWRDALLLTGGAWLASRLVTWWMTDLLRGMSPLG